MFIIAMAVTKGFVVHVSVSQYDRARWQRAFDEGHLHATPGCWIGQVTWQYAELRETQTSGSHDLFNYPASAPVLELEFFEEEFLPEGLAEGGRSTEYSCLPEGGHEYSEKTCRSCGKDFCYSCCGSQNVDQGGKHEEDFMTCPTCGYDWYTDHK